MLSEKTTAGTAHESTSPSIPVGGANYEKIIDVSISDPNQTTIITEGENAVGTANSIIDGRSSSSQNMIENDSKLVDQNFTAQKKKEENEKINREQLKLTKQNSKLEE